MSLYKDKKINLDLKNKKPLLISIGIFIVIILIYILINSIDFSIFDFKENNINIKFNNNPFVIGKDDSIEMEITIKNNTEKDAENSILIINPVENIFKVDCPISTQIEKNTILIPIIAENNKRIIYCNVTPKSNINNIIEGTYSFDIIFTLNKQNQFSEIENKKRAILEIKR
jgi:hypothetical protein